MDGSEVKGRRRRSMGWAQLKKLKLRRNFDRRWFLLAYGWANSNSYIQIHIEQPNKRSSCGCVGCSKVFAEFSQWLTIWSMVCSGFPQSHAVISFIFHFCRWWAIRAEDVRIWFHVNYGFQDKSDQWGFTAGSVIKYLLGILVFSQRHRHFS